MSAFCHSEVGGGSPSRPRPIEVNRPYPLKMTLRPNEVLH